MQNNYTIRDLCCYIKQELNSALEAEVIISYILGVERSFLYAHSDDILSKAQFLAVVEIIKRRQNKEPLAYILGYKWFWDFKLKINCNVLVPREETELLVRIVLKLQKNFKIKNVLDLGTGSGAIALALAQAMPTSYITAVDLSKAALDVAFANAKEHGVDNINFLQYDWHAENKNLDLAFKGQFDFIVSNPPYIASDDAALLSDGVQHEPKMALVPRDGNALSDLARIISIANKYLKVSGYLVLEHGTTQGQAVREIMHSYGLIKAHTYQDDSNHDRVTVGQYVS